MNSISTATRTGPMSQMMMLLLLLPMLMRMPMILRQLVPALLTTQAAEQLPM